jgi:uncharacterized protein (TIGR03437 family)
MRLLLALLLSVGLLLFTSLPYSYARPGSIPPIPSTRAERFGVYNWNVDDRAYPGNTDDRLNWGAQSVAAAGSKTIRVFVGPRDIYHLKSNGPASFGNLAQLAASPAYDKLFRDPRFSTYFLTAYTYSNLQNRWGDGFSQTEYEAERSEIRTLGLYLLGNSAFAGKTFIVINWEGDNEIYGSTNKQSTWDSYLRSVEARAEGVRQAREAMTTQQVKLYSALEFNLVRSLATDQPCGTPVADPVNQDPLSNRCVIDYIAPRASVDYYSYSSWQSITAVHLNPALDFGAELKADVRSAVALVRTMRPEVTEANFVIGEYGFERARFGECRSAELVRSTFEALNAPDGLGVSYAIFWQIIDSASLYGVLDDRFGLLRTVEGGLNRSLGWTLPGAAFKKGIAGEDYQVPAGCPGIKRLPQGWGVVDDTSGLPHFRLEPDSVLSISSDEPFSTTGNTVHFAQSGSKSALAATNGGIVNESAANVTARLPQVRRPGDALVFVSNNNSVDSNAQAITLECVLCPKIAPWCGVVNRRHETEATEPGSVISIRGSFQPQGNRVFVEQQWEGGVPVRTFVDHDGNWKESSSEITGTLPASLTRDSDASVTVIDKDGRYSASAPIFLRLPCDDCGPVVSHCLERPSNGGDFHPGAIVSLPGDYPRTGNRIVIEQYDEHGALTRRTLTSGARGWSETDYEIRFGLPAQIQSGRAIVYVVDSIGRESTAWNIKISPAPLEVVSAASFRTMSSTPGGIVAGFGSALATATAAGWTMPLPSELGGTTVVIRDSANVEHKAPLFFVSPMQVNFQIPSDVALGPGVIVVESSDGTLSTLSTNIARVEPGIFAANANGEGPAAGDFIHVAADGNQQSESPVVFDSGIGRFVPAQVAFGPEQEQLFLILYGTGIRLLSSQQSVQVGVGGVSSEVTYAGPQGGFVGLDQINVRLPRALVGRGLINVELVVDGRNANVLQVWIK